MVSVDLGVKCLKSLLCEMLELSLFFEQTYHFLVSHLGVPHN